MNKFFLAVSTVFSPLLVPTYGVILAMSLTFLALLPPATRWLTVGMLFFMTAVIPAGSIMVMKRLGMVSDHSLSERNERTPPYLISAVCYLAATIYLLKVHSPDWLWLFIAAAMVAMIVNVVITRWWKISAHMTAMGGLVALLFRLQFSHIAIYDMQWWIVGAIVLTGIVGSARIYRERHDLWQVLAGTACGFICVFFITMIQ